MGGTARITRLASTRTSPSANTVAPDSFHCTVRTGALRKRSSPRASGHADRYLLHSADHSLVEDEVLVDEVGERACGSGHEYGLQGRERVGGLGEHATGDEKTDVVTCLGVVGLIDQPLLEGDCVEIAGEGMCPRFLGADLGCEIVHLVDETVHLLLRGVVRGEGITRVLRPLTCRRDVDGLALAVALESFQAEFVEQGDQRGLVGGDPLAADFQNCSVDGVGPRAGRRRGRALRSQRRSNRPCAARLQLPGQRGRRRRLQRLSGD